MIKEQTSYGDQTCRIHHASAASAALTQEQLAEVLGVTVGAVYKWEAGLSTPELPLIVEMADFFDTSIDVLLGYILRDNRIDATARRLRHCQRVKDLNGLEEAEKALKKYPNSFIIVYRSAMLYQALGLYKRDNAKLRRPGTAGKPVRFCTRIPTPASASKRSTLLWRKSARTWRMTNAPWSFSGSTTPTASIATASA